MQMQTQRRLMQIPGTAGGIYTDFYRGEKGKKINMKEKQFKGVWLKFIAVLVAVAMVIPLAFSGLTQTKAYADDAGTNYSLSPTLVADTDLIPNKVEMDPNMPTEPVYVTLNGRRVERLTGNVQGTRLYGPSAERDGYLPEGESVAPSFANWRFSSEDQFMTHRYDKFKDTDSFVIMSDLDSYSGSNSEKIEKMKQDVANWQVDINYPYIGTYINNDGTYTKIGMRVHISNIEYEPYVWTWPGYLDGSNDSMHGYVSGAAFQISSKPSYGILQHNIHQADYVVELFDANSPNGAPLENATDVWLTFSSLSYYESGVGSMAGMNRGNGSVTTLANFEKVRPLSSIDQATVSPISAILDPKATDNRGEQSNWTSVVRPLDPPKTENIANISPRSVDENYNAVKTGDNTFIWKAHGTGGLDNQTDQYGDGLAYDTSDDGYYVSAPWGPNNTASGRKNWSGQEYTDEVGDATFTEKAVGLKYSDASDIQFRTSTTGNTMWFTLYPQALQSSVPDKPSITILQDPKKGVALLEDQETIDNNVNNSLYITPGEEVEFVANQTVNRLDFNALRRYETFEMNIEIPAGYTYVPDSASVEGTLKLPAGQKYDSSNGVVADANVTEDAEYKVTPSVTYTTAPGENGATIVTAKFDSGWVEGKTMPLAGEDYKLTIKATASDDSQYHEKELTASTFSLINTTKVPDDVEKNNDNSRSVSVSQIANKEINTEQVLPEKASQFTYTVTQLVPADATAVELSDTLDKNLHVINPSNENVKFQFIDDEVDEQGNPTGNKILRDVSELSELMTKISVTPSSRNNTGSAQQVIKASITDTPNGSFGERYVTEQLRGKTLVLTINAEIMPDATEHALLQYDGNKIPNTADVTFNNDPNYKMESNPAYVLPPDKPEKAIIGSDGTKTYIADGTEFGGEEFRGEHKGIHTDTFEPGDTFTYVITQGIPKDAINVRIKDKLDDVVSMNEDLDKNVRIYALKENGQRDLITDLKLTGQGEEIEVTLENDQMDKLKGNVLLVEVDCKFVETDSNEHITANYETVDEVTTYSHTGVPNKATVIQNFGTDSEVSYETNTVTVTAPPEKQVGDGTDQDNQKALDASAYEVARDQSFTYTVTDRVPANADRIIMEDTLNEVLEFYSKGIRVSEGGKWRSEKAIEELVTVTLKQNGNNPETLKYGEDYTTLVALTPDGVNTLNVTLTDEGLKKAAGKVVATPNKPEDYAII